MKYKNQLKTKKIIVMFFIIIMILSAGGSVFAANNEFVVKKGKTYNKTNMLNTYSSFNNEGVIDGGVIIYSPEMENRGVVKGDVISVSDSFNNKGDIWGNVLGYYKKLYLNNSNIEKNIYVLSNEIISKEKMNIGGDLSVYAKKVELKGNVKGDVKIIAEEVILDAKVDGEVKIYAKDIVLGDSLNVGSNLYYESEAPIIKSKDSVIKGEIKEKELGYRLLPVEDVSSAIKLFSNSYSTLCYFSILIIGIILARLFPITFYKNEVLLKRNLLTCVGIGGLTYILLLPIMLLLAVSAVGIPVMFMLMGLFVVIFYFSLLPASIFLGSTFVKGEGGYVIKIGIGLVILYFLKRLPFLMINSLITMFVNLLGVGSIVFMIMMKLKVKYKSEQKDMNNLMKAIIENRNRHYNRKGQMNADNRDSQNFGDEDKDSKNKDSIRRDYSSMGNDYKKEEDEEEEKNEE